jgi:hypothetical protein
MGDELGGRRRTRWNCRGGRPGHEDEAEAQSWVAGTRGARHLSRCDVEKLYRRRRSRQGSCRFREDDTDGFLSCFPPFALPPWPLHRHPTANVPTLPPPYPLVSFPPSTAISCASTSRQSSRLACFRPPTSLAPPAFTSSLRRRHRLPIHNLPLPLPSVSSTTSSRSSASAATRCTPTTSSRRLHRPGPLLRRDHLPPHVLEAAVSGSGAAD